ncbi:MAG: V-type ATPase 116kDa subunit family protein, partial [Candidatus Methanofastidiosia archaeon]
MLKSQKMSRIAIIGTKGVLREVVEKLYELSMLHIVDFTEESDDFRIGKPQEIASKYSEYLLSVRAILSFVGEEVPKRKFKKSEILSRIEEVISSCSPQVDKIRSRRAEVERELLKISEYLEFKEKVEVLEVSEDIFERYENLSCLFGISDDDPSHFIENPDIILKTAKLEKLYVNAIFSPLEFENELREILKQVNFAEIPIVEREERFSKPNERREELLSELLKIEGEILKLREKYSEFLMAANEYFSSEIEKAEAPLKFATSDSAFIAEGWIPEREFERLSKEVESISSGKAYVQKLKTIVTEETPIVLSNPKPVEPVELLTNTFSIPKYGEIDPSIILYVAFPLFYGFMLGDVGYGLLLGFMGYAIKKNWKNSFVWISDKFT